MSITIACQHDIAEQETACVDGLCPLCLQAEVERQRLRIKDLEINSPAQAALDAIDKLTAERNDYKAESERHIETIAKLRAEIELVSK